MKIEYTEAFADFNEQGNHRYALGRVWSGYPFATVIGLNPSTANHEKDDPTIKSIVRILNNNGYGKLIMLNLFTYITPYPEELQRVNTCAYDGKQALKILRTHSQGNIVFAWGKFKTYGRDRMVIKEFGDRALCFGKNADGSPKHPLYLKSTTQLQSFKP